MAAEQDIDGSEAPFVEPPARPLPSPMPVHRVLLDPWVTEEARKLLASGRTWRTRDSEALILARALSIIVRGRALAELIRKEVAAGVGRPRNAVKGLKVSYDTAVSYDAADKVMEYLKRLTPEDRALAAATVLERAVAQLKLRDEKEKQK